MLVPRQLLARGPHSRVVLCAVGDKPATQQPLVLKVTRLSRAATAAADRRVAAAAEAAGGPPGSSAAERALRELQLSGRALGPFVIASQGWLGNQERPQALLLLEYLPGGDLGLLLERQGPLGPQAARFYFGCAALGLETLHGLGVVHRDLKPENLCVDVAGYAKIVDLGHARELPEGGRAHTLLGTPEYLSPEIFLGEGHGTPCDLWALGATLYTLLLAAHPYGGAEPSDIYAEALRGPPFFPPVVTPAAAAQLITACLQREPSARPTAAAVWSSEFFGAGGFLRAEALRREAVLGRTASPPFVPRLHSPFDASHFDRPEPDAEASDGEGSHSVSDDGELPSNGEERHVDQPDANDLDGLDGLRGVGGGRLRMEDFRPAGRACASLDELLCPPIIGAVGNV